MWEKVRVRSGEIAVMLVSKHRCCMKETKFGEKLDRMIKEQPV